MCTFEPKNNGFSLTISCIGSDKISLDVSREIKQDIRGCDTLLASATILRTVRDGQSIADKMQRAYEQEQIDIQVEYDDLQNYNDSDSDAELWGDFIDDDCEYDSRDSSFSL